MSIHNSTDPFDREIVLTRQNQALMTLLEQRAKQDQTIALEEAKSLLGIDKSDESGSDTT